jgi:hypothetical protein
MKILPVLLIGLMFGCMSTKSLSRNQSLKNSPVGIDLLNEISSFSDYMDNLMLKNNFSESNIITVVVKKENEECYLIIGSSDLYNYNLMKGYIFLKNKLVVFYESSGCCDFNLVDYNKLKKKKPKGYNDQFSEESKHIYDPFGRKYKINNNKVLELIYEGFY